MYIDDNPLLIANSPSTLKFIKQIPKSSEKTHVLTDYKSNRKVTGPNIYHLKNEDFAIAVLEYRTKKLDQGIQELKTIKKTNPVPNWLIVFSIISIISTLLLLIIHFKEKAVNY